MPALAHALARQLGAELRETHISWVLLTPGFAYKLKKALRLPFVDYSTLERRRIFCEEEVRLNGRLAPSLYLGVAPITGTEAAPVLGGEGAPIEYAVRMRRFAEGALFGEQLAAGTLQPEAVDAFADLIAAFHLQAPSCRAPALAGKAVAALEGASALLTAPQAQELGHWLHAQEAQLARLLGSRRRREGHGDLHLDNVVLTESGVAAFDCIEFDPALRCIDVIEDAAFAFMDFSARGRPGYAWRFLNRWLDRTGDHAALPALRWATVYRALVRAQVEQLRQPRGEAARRYARAALGWLEPAEPRLAITHGLPGSGKTSASQRWLEREGAVRLRSDVERKRLFGLGMFEDSRGAGLDIYTPQATRRTYDVLYAKAETALRAGYPVILDAAFLRRAERDEARDFAASLRVPFTLLDCDAPLHVLRARLQARRGDASEADGAVLDRLAAAAEPLGADERSEPAP